MPHQFGANNTKSVLATCHMTWQKTGELRSTLHCRITWFSKFRILCLFRCLKLFRHCTIFDWPLPQILQIFWQLNLGFLPLHEYLLFFGVNVLCSLSEAFRYSGFKNISLKLLSCWVTMNLAERWWQFGWRMSRKCHAFASKILYFALPPNSTSPLSMKFCI